MVSRCAQQQTHKDTNKGSTTMASSIAKRPTTTGTQFGSIAANVAMLNKSEVETYLDNLCSDLNTALDGKVDSVSAADASVTVTGGKAAQVGVAISAATGNLLQLAEDGLKVIAPSAAEYTIQKAAEAESGFAATYKLMKDGVQVGASINLIKDMVVSSGTVETKSTSGDWGAAGTYLVLTLANATNDKVYINVGDLIEYVTSGSTAGDQIVISVSSDHKVTASISAGTVTATELSSGVNADIAKGVAAKTATDAILDGSTLDSFGDVETALAGKQANLTETQLAAVNSGITAAKVTKLDGIAEGAEVNVQADWNVTDTDSDAFIKNKPTLGDLAALDEVAEANLASALATKINGKVDKVEGKGLSTEDYTTAEKTKLSGIEAGAQVNVQSDWSAASGDAAILNKPTLGDLAAKDEVALTDLASDVTTKLNGYDSDFADVDAKVAAAADVTIPGENEVTLRSLRTAVIALKNAFAATAA